MANEDNVAIAPIVPVAAPGSTVPVIPAPTLIKTFRVLDANNQVVEIQAVALVNADGRAPDPLTEQTGRDILEMLRRLHNVMADYTGTGINIPMASEGG